MDANNYVIAAALNALRHKQLGTLPWDAELTPFNLWALRDTPKRTDRFKPDPEQTRPQEAFASSQSSGSRILLTSETKTLLEQQNEF